MSETRAALVIWARDTIGKGSKSFGLASKLLPPDVRENAWLLYSWCRACDDATDGQELGFATAAPQTESLDLWALTRSALTSDAPVPPAFAALRAVHRASPLPLVSVEDHLRGFDLDLRGWRPETQDDLLGYCYHVAGAVGGMMAAIMGVDPADDDTMARACDLGIAFQLNNIARDIADDAAVGRCYIPTQWLTAVDMVESDLADPVRRPELAGFAARLTGMAARYDRSARIGAARLVPRCRLAILAAANIYGLIGTKVAAAGARAWDERVSTSGADKGVAIAKAVMQSLSNPASVSRETLFNRSDWVAANPGHFTRALAA